MLLIFPLPERGIASLGQTVNNEKGACECERISIGCYERSVDKTQCHIEQRESSRGVKKRGRGGSCQKCGKNKKVVREALPSVTDELSVTSSGISS